MTYLTLLFLGVTVGLSGAMLPGPLLLFTVDRVLKHDMKEGMKVVAGHAIIEAVMIALVLGGLSTFWRSQAVIRTISLLGGGALIVVGALMVRNAPRYKLPFEIEAREERFRYGALLGGIFFSAFNPTFPLWWGTIGASLLSRALLAGGIGLVVLVIGHWLSDVIWYATVSFTVARGRQIMKKRTYVTAVRILGTILVCFGGYFLFGPNISL
jgi:threonine/homoserine/homoserine lactone efflux protein